MVNNTAIASGSGPGLVTVARLGNGSLVPVANRRLVASGDQRGMVSAEWAVGIILAISLVGVVLTIVTKGPVRAALANFFLNLIGTFVKVGQGG